MSERLQNDLNELRTELDCGTLGGHNLHIEIMPETEDGKESSSKEMIKRISITLSIYYVHNTVYRAGT